MGEEKGLVSFFTRDAQYELSNSSILIPTKLRRNGLSEIINQLLDLQTRIEFDFIIDGKFLKNSIKHYLDLNSLSTENVTRIEVVEATLPPTNEQKLIHDDWISSIHMKENNMILTGSYDSFVRLWGADGKVIDALSAGKDPIKCVQWIDDSSFLSGDARSNIYGYKVKGNKIVDSFKCIGHLGSIESLAVSENKEIVFYHPNLVCECLLG
jgi:ribosome biogenesis protein YTM1